MGRSAASNKDEREFQEFFVTRESFNRYFEKPQPTSTFHDLVNKGKITPFKFMRGHYLLNDSLRRLGLRRFENCRSHHLRPVWMTSSAWPSA